MIASTQTNHPIAGHDPSGKRKANAIEVAARRLRGAGLRITRPRLAIVAALAGHTQPASIEQLHAEVGASKCDVVTVYRCISAFEDIGLVRRAFVHNGTTHYALNLAQPERYHVVCKTTRQIEELDDATSEQLQRAIGKVQRKLRERGYRDIGHVVEFFGIAPAPARIPATPASAPPSR